MSMTRAGKLLGALIVSSLVAHAQSVNVTGAWRVTISLADGQIEGYSALKQDGDKVSGWVGPSEDDPIPVDGTLSGGKLILMTHPQPGRTVAFSKCELTVTADKLTGTIDGDKGKIVFTRRDPSLGH
jgi:hypothetical protein